MIENYNFYMRWCLIDGFVNRHRLHIIISNKLTSTNRMQNSKFVQIKPLISLFVDASYKRWKHDKLLSKAEKFSKNHSLHFTHFHKLRFPFSIEAYTSRTVITFLDLNNDECCARVKLDRAPDIAFMEANEEVEVHHISFFCVCSAILHVCTFKNTQHEGRLQFAVYGVDKRNRWRLVWMRWWWLRGWWLNVDPSRRVINENYFQKLLEFIPLEKLIFLRILLTRQKLVACYVTKPRKKLLYLCASKLKL